MSARKQTSRNFTRDFVVLRKEDKRLRSVPRRGRLETLLNAGRIDNIEFNDRDSAEHILSLLVATFACLRDEPNLLKR